MTDKEKVATRERAKKEMKVLDIYVDEAFKQMGPNVDFTRLMQYACTAYLGACLSDIDGSVEGLYEHIGQL